MALLLGAGLVAVPMLIHLLAKPRPVRVKYSTVRFVNEAVKHRRSLFRFRDFLVVCLRIAAVILLAAAFARLFTRSSSAVAVEGDEPTVRVVLLDTSQSMMARRSVVQVFDRAKAAAVKYVKKRDNLKANVIACAGQARPLFDRVSENLTALEVALATVEARNEALDAKAALAEAARMLSSAASQQPQRMELVIISDFQRTNWDKALFEIIPSGVSWRFEQVGLTGETANIGICDIRPAAPARSGEPCQIVVDIGNYSSSDENVTVRFESGDVTGTVEAKCPAWMVTPVGMTIPTGKDAQVKTATWVTGTVRVEGAKDAVEADDGRPFAVNVTPAKRYVILTREEKGIVGTSRYFVEKALSAGVHDSCSIIHPMRLDYDQVHGADVVILVDPGRMTTQACTLIASSALRGIPVLYVVTSPRDAENLFTMERECNKALALPVTFTGDVLPVGMRRRIGTFRAGEQPFRILAEQAELLKSIEFGGGVRTIARSGGESPEVLAAYEDGQAALVLAPCGRGRLAVLNCDVAASTLPASPLFVPFIQELAERLTRENVSAATFAAVGSPLGIFLPAGAASAMDIRIEGPPAGGGSYGKIDDTEVGVFWSWPAVERVGVYRALENGRVIHAVAAACPGAESDLRTIDATELEKSVSGAKAVDVRRSTTETEESDRRHEYWPYLMLAAVGCLVLELAVLKIFRT